MARLRSRTLPHGKRVLLRVDFNVPIARGRVGDEFDIARVLPTIRRLARNRNVIVLLSHHSDERRSLAPLAPHLSRLLGRPVAFLRDPLSRAAASNVRRAPPASVFLVENVRFWRGERSGSPTFAARLAKLGEVFVNDAFGELHRPYASIVGIPRFLPSFAGPLVRAELAMLGRFRTRPPRPLIGIFGGAKVATKLAILRRFLRVADGVLVGGTLANTLLASAGVPVGRSRVERRTPDLRRMARSSKLILPRDVVVLRRGKRATVPPGRVAGGDRIFDIGPATVRRFREAIRKARTVVWNGPLGVVERPSFRAGTLAVARRIARHPGRVLVGGGDTVAFLSRSGLLERFKHVSTGGGAMLAYLAGEKLPGLEALRR